MIIAGDCRDRRRKYTDPRNCTERTHFRRLGEFPTKAGEEKHASAHEADLPCPSTVLYRESSASGLLEMNE